MVSGVSFKNPTDQKKDLRRGSRVSRGLLFSFVILFVTVAVFGAVWSVMNSHRGTIEGLEQQITQKREMIAEAAEGPLAEYVAKSNAIKHGVFSAASPEMVLADLHETMVPRVVFKSFLHTYDTREESYRVAITADADNFDVLAKQIQTWKDGTRYSIVNAKETSRDDEGRIIFNVDMLLMDEGVGPYDMPMQDADIMEAMPAVEGAESLEAPAVPGNDEEIAPELVQ